MPNSLSLKPELLNLNGLNLQCVFNINELPVDIVKQLTKQVENLHQYHQLILIGHGGKRLWEALPKSTLPTDTPAGNNPIDSCSLETVSRWLNSSHTSLSFQVMYPIIQSVNLIELGILAGWHHESPFKVGINNQWGPWFAYRSVVLADSNFPITQPLTSSSPCSTCDHKICIDSCPANACDTGELNIEKCINYRKSPHSQCSKTCLARVSCPIKTEHRYTEAQINYHYTESMRTINHYNL